MINILLPLWLIFIFTLVSSTIVLIYKKMKNTFLSFLLSCVVVLLPFSQIIIANYVFSGYKKSVNQSGPGSYLIKDGEGVFVNIESLHDKRWDKRGVEEFLTENAHFLDLKEDENIYQYRLDEDGNITYKKIEESNATYEIHFYENKLPFYLQPFVRWHEKIEYKNRKTKEIYCVKNTYVRNQPKLFLGLFPFQVIGDSACSFYRADNYRYSDYVINKELLQSKGK